MRVKNLFDLTGKVAIITGGAGLLGEKHAEAIAEFGGIPVLVDLNEKLAEHKAQRVALEFNVDALGVRTDVTNEANLIALADMLLKRYGRVDILINNAANDPKVGAEGASVSFSRVEYFPLEQWNNDISVGLTGAFLCSKVFGTVMAKVGKGVILNISSDLGVIAPDQRIYKKEGLLEGQQPVKPISYCVVKSALISLTKYLATYWAEKNIRVNSLSPGGVYTNQDEQFLSKLTNLIPMKRMAEKNEYKAAIAFLVSEASSYMTGANVIIDGGRSVW